MNTSKDISIGSGHLYVMAWPADGTIPADTTIEVAGNRLGFIKDGATLTYTPTYYEAKDDLGRVKKTILTEEDLVFKTGIITWDLDTIAKLAQTANCTTDENGKKTLLLGGVGNFVPVDYLVRFVHQDGNQRVTMKADVQSVLELAYKKDAETSVNAEFHAQPLDDDGHLVKYEDLRDYVEPEPDPGP